VLKLAERATLHSGGDQPQGPNAGGLWS
jgi:hypothetical protein